MAGEADESAAHEDGSPGPRALLMQEVAAQMDAIEAEFGDSFEIGRVITVVEVRKADDDVELRVRSGEYPWVALGMLETAKKIVEGMGG
jgi:hypothetical protein